MDRAVSEVEKPEGQPSEERAWPAIGLGMTRGMENDAYHGDRSAVSSTQLKRMLISPAHFLSQLSDPEESTEAMQYGTVLHARLLEPDTFNERFYGMPSLDKRTKEGKAEFERHNALARGRVVFPVNWMRGIERIVDNAMLHRQVRSILSAGEAELAFAWIDRETGIKLKIKVDWMSNPTLLADVKSALDVTRDGFSKACARLGYALSAHMYCDGVFQCTGEDPSWWFIACEKDAPNTVAAYHASEGFMRRGQEMYRRALRRLAECRERGAFPMLQGAGEGEEIDLPRWA
ncbi:PD-(D/E)XK nuclease-like domain-containing protein [Biomphalaria pfeifferi]|uniref:PD-(D/E)XK nuclease-like domain-containing protein n=1 Tax=Biomphalaria pfeifferi TaxID=112525 RepID=A0AAD8EUR3_BIOPF|nr:PD-(D/E)XK nuclease-like domain-containing protein [Biomphalaria pfeifferi]